MHKRRVQGVDGRLVEGREGTDIDDASVSLVLRCLLTARTVCEFLSPRMFPLAKQSASTIDKGKQYGRITRATFCMAIICLIVVMTHFHPLTLNRLASVIDDSAGNLLTEGCTRPMDKILLCSIQHRAGDKSEQL